MKEQYGQKDGKEEPKMKKWIVVFLLVGLPLAFVPVAGAKTREMVKIGGDVVAREGMRVSKAVAIGRDVTMNGGVEDDAVAGPLAEPMCSVYGPNQILVL